MRASAAVAIPVLLLCWYCSGTALAAEAAAPEHAVVLEFGAAGEWPTRGGAANFGGSVSAECTPIEHWLEIEGGLTALGSTGRSELSGELLFKKPWELSPTVE